MLERGTSLDTLLLEKLAFLDHRDIEWSRVRRVRYFAHQRFRYDYTSFVRDLAQRLVVVPPARYGDQRLREAKLSVEPIPLSRRESTDRFGNRVFEVEVSRVDHWAEFEVMMTVERVAGSGSPPTVAPAELDLFSHPTRLTAPDERMEEVARDLAAGDGGPAGFAERACEWVYTAMRYGSGVTSVGTAAAEALSVGQGLCQDYAHITIGLCRAAGFPARYVSGHMLGEGGSHAWVEVLVPGSDGRASPLALDPTNRRRPNLGYVTVAVGRDYGDVSPASGHFTSSSRSKLSFIKRAGLTFLEYEDGRVLLAGDSAVTAPPG